MIPNLVAAVKSYMGHENETLTRIAELRSRTFQPSQESEQIKTGNELSSLISKLQLSVEDYPELKASEQFTRLQRSIEDMELQLQAIRRTYNAAVTDYNNSIEMFPLPFAFKIYFKIHISHLEFIIYHIITICQYVSLYIVL